MKVMPLSEADLPEDHRLLFQLCFYIAPWNSGILSFIVIIKLLIKKKSHILTKLEQSTVSWELLFTFPGDTPYTSQILKFLKNEGLNVNLLVRESGSWKVSRRIF